MFLVEELGLAYTLHRYDRDPLIAPPAFKALHPIGASPVIEDDEQGRAGEHVTIAETEACFAYILAVHGQDRFTVKAGEKGYADYLYYYYLTNGTLQPAVGRVMTLRIAGVAEEHPTLGRYVDKIHQILGLIDQRLGEVPWLGGQDFTGECYPKRGLLHEANWYGGHGSCRYDGHLLADDHARILSHRFEQLQEHFTLSSEGGCETCIQAVSGEGRSGYRHSEVYPRAATVTLCCATAI